MSGRRKTYPRAFYACPTVGVARDLLGSWLCRRLPDGTVVRAFIVEAEAYTADDPACHAFRGLTPRCEVMFGPPGRAYVYFIYGMYFCFNVVTEEEGIPGAVLIRAVDIDGGNGPGKLCRALKITGEHNGIDLCDANGALWIEQRTAVLSADQIGVSIRVGISVAQERPWRFFVKEHPGVSVKLVKPYVRRPRKVSKS
ncbi:MAG: DNA-3-methyladenine glycosylase [Candidatus Obscuribacterales bacterium]|nr:DNA-3-methyladenine glycosylase [Candidatus Obscuribacterales bacterium]